MTNPDDSEPKIIVDDDWKTQVQAEKEALKAKEAEKETTKAASTASTDSAASAASDESATEPVAEAPAQDSGPREFPPASFSMLVTTISAQAMTALGFFPDPSGQSNPNRAMAKHFIDTLGVLEEKTAGNLDDEEKGMLQETLHQLRMAFINPPEMNPPQA